MTNLKDKLSASVRQAKASAQPAAKSAVKAAVKTAVKTRRSPASVAAKPVVSKPMATPVVESSAPRPQTPRGIDFPERVWPD